MKQIFLVYLLCLALMISAAPVSQAATVEDYSKILNFFPLLGETTDKLPDFVTPSPYLSFPGRSCYIFEGIYGDMSVLVQAWENRICTFQILLRSRDLDAKFANEIFEIFKNKYGAPNDYAKEYHQWNNKEFTLYINASNATVGKIFVGSINGTHKEYFENFVENSR